jgi:LDH2 family malate/lactate/ureidoglycolate dehydrogenase
MQGEERREVRVDASALTAFSLRALMAVGVPEGDAEVTVESMIRPSLRGEGDHGARLVYIWARKIMAGAIDPLTPMEMIEDHPATALYDAHNGIGAVAATRAMNHAIDKARNCGIGWVGVRYSNSMGAAGYFAMIPLRHRMIGISVTNGCPLIVPPGGLEVRTGTNPIAIAAPTKEAVPVVLDMACAQLAYERLRVYANRGVMIPAGWAIDAEGNEVTDPRTVAHDAFRGGGGLIGIGEGYKGFALSVMVNVLTSVLNGGVYKDGPGEFFPYEMKERNSFFQAAINIEHFMPYDTFVERLDDFVRHIKSAKRRTGVEEIMLPGEGSHRREEARRERGLPLDPVTAQEFATLARDLGIEPVAHL